MAAQPVVPPRSAGSDTYLSPIPDHVLRTLQRQLEEFGLVPNEARVMLALLQLRSSPALGVARLAGVARTSVYPLLEALRSKRLADVLPGKQAMWTTPGIDAVLDRLFARQQQSFEALSATTEEVRRSLHESLPTQPPSGFSPVHIITDSGEARSIYDELVAKARDELLVFNRPPYTWTPGTANSVVIDALNRGVATRVLYQEAQLLAEEAGSFRAEQELYQRSGVEGRVVDQLDFKLVVVDRRTALVALTDVPDAPEGFPTVLVIEHAPYAAAHADAFERRWAAARPYPGVGKRAASVGKLGGGLAASRSVSERSSS